METEIRDLEELIELLKEGFVCEILKLELERLKQK